MTELDALFDAARRGDVDGFADWMGRAERPVRLALRPFARAVDVEGVVQEAMLRMWLLARDGTRELTGDNASLRFAIGMARNLARNEARRFGREDRLPPEQLPEPAVAPEPPPDPGLRRAIEQCLERLAGQPLAALRARLEGSHAAGDRTLAARAGMTPNTFFQNVARARRQLGECLERRGVPVREWVS